MNQPNINYQQTRLEHTKRKYDTLGLPDLRGKRYADLGCNAGMFCRFAADEGASKIVGVDIDAHLLDIARENVPEAEFFNFRFEDIVLDDHTFDVITIASAIHYSKRFLNVADIILDLLADDGLLVIEGGLYDPDGKTELNTPVPNWREIGDHCRHLSRRFVADVLFPHCEVTLVGPSLKQGGDNLKRYAIHIRKRPGEQRPTTPVTAQLDLPEFLKAITTSDTTIHDKYPIKAYFEVISRLSEAPYAPVAPEQLEALAKFIKAEIAYCTSDWADSVVYLDVGNTHLGQLICSGTQDSR
ncbi:class I SAM-dependent methyltransferase [uncultured Erythrobacter sp.]|uniref:class I SAM-dependent methyltransferase n=1 Tax=uncultured Erythrobacter sp. TaxID=263913 RepID=UPI002608C27E|nr:class I SAM-dependent methyltransferase [uncultured Erythrobacter sp.]